MKFRAIPKLFDCCCESPMVLVDAERVMANPALFVCRPCLVPTAGRECVGGNCPRTSGDVVTVETNFFSKLPYFWGYLGTTFTLTYAGSRTWSISLTGDPAHPLGVPLFGFISFSCTNPGGCQLVAMQANNGGRRPDGTVDPDRDDGACDIAQASFPSVVYGTKTSYFDEFVAHCDNGYPLVPYANEDLFEDTYAIVKWHS